MIINDHHTSLTNIHHRASFLQVIITISPLQEPHHILMQVWQNEERGEEGQQL